MDVAEGRRAVHTPGASGRETRKGWSHQVGFLEEAAVRIWKEVGTRSRWKGMAEGGRQGCQRGQGHTCRVGPAVERTARVPRGRLGAELSTC